MSKQTPFKDTDEINPYEVCFTGMKIKYLQYASMIRARKFLSPNDKVNVCINVETLLHSLVSIRDVDNIVIGDKDFTTICVSGIINLAAHYKRFFRKYGLDTKVFLYYSNLNSKSFKNTKYEKHYREYYHDKFLSGKYYVIGRKLVDEIIPMVSKIMEFIPDTYFIKTDNIDSSLVPMVISKLYPDRKNFIVTGDNYDTQYMNYPGFFTILVRRASTQVLFISDLDKIIPLIFRDNMAVVNNVDVFYNKMFYSMCLASTGDHRRNIKSVKGIGPKTVSNKIKNAIKDGELTSDCGSVDICCSIFGEESDNMRINCRCINLDSQFSDMTDADFFEVKNQITDRYDRNSLEELNRTIYQFYPLMINELIN